MRAPAPCLLFLAVAASCTASRPAGTAARDAAVLPDPRAAVCPDGGAPTSVAFAKVQQVFDENCLSCHGSAGDVPELSEGAAWTSLVGQPSPAPETCGGVLVVPGDSAGSYLYQKLSSARPCSGEQMPRGELFSDPLPSCVVALIARWIDEGAPGPDGGAGAPPAGGAD